jgi:hypothetical protein
MIRIKQRRLPVCEALNTSHDGFCNSKPVRLARRGQLSELVLPVRQRSTTYKIDSLELKHGCLGRWKF